MVINEKVRIDSGRTWASVLINDFTYKQEGLYNTQVYTSTVGKSIFHNGSVTNFTFSSTDIDELNLYGTSWSQSKFRYGGISRITLNKAHISYCLFSTSVIGPGHFGNDTKFEHCKFDNITFYGINFDHVKFDGCKFVDCVFMMCSFNGRDSYLEPYFRTQNKFIGCSMEKVSFDSCSFNVRLNTIKAEVQRGGRPSPSIDFTKCKGTLTIRNTVSNKGLNTMGFLGTVSYDSKSTDTRIEDKNNIDHDDDDESCWNSLIDTTGAWPVVDRTEKPKKSKAPVRYISMGLQSEKV